MKISICFHRYEVRMTITYLAHSSFLIKCGDLTLVFDPWLKGPSYSKQWFLWPLPPEKIDFNIVDVILISHGHEDHLHIESLNEFEKSSHIFFPFQWRKGIKPFLKTLGFKKITEAVSFRTYFIKDVKITYIGFSLESVIVVEYDGEVLVNINDALNSNHESAVNFMLKEINAKWPKIDYLLSGWSGASYFPNQIRYPGKNDIEIGRLREQYFANNFCRFTNFLQPKFSIPFVPGFVLLKKENQWINHIKFPRENVNNYYVNLFKIQSDINFIIAYPGDSIEKGELKKLSYLHEIPEKDQYTFAYKHYSKQILESNSIGSLDKNENDKLVNDLRYWINSNKQLYHQKVLQDTVFSIRLEDAKENNFINIFYSENKFIVERSNTPLNDRRLLINTTGEKLIYALKKEWGGDIITIGYGLTVDIYDQLTLEKNLDIVCVRLITRYPIARKDLRKYPIRALKYYTSNPRLTSLWLKQKIHLKSYVNKYPYNERDHWLTYNKCDLCAVCKMPNINLEVF